MFKETLEKLKAKFKGTSGKWSKNSLLIGVALVAIVVTGVLLLANPKSGYSKVFSFLKFSPAMSADAVSKKAVDYLNTKVLQQGQTATLENVSEESGVIKMKIKIGESSYDSYATRDGKLLFPQALKMDEASVTE